MVPVLLFFFGINMFASEYVLSPFPFFWVFERGMHLRTECVSKPNCGSAVQFFGHHGLTDGSMRLFFPYGVVSVSMDYVRDSCLSSKTDIEYSTDRRDSQPISTNTTITTIAPRVKKQFGRVSFSPSDAPPFYWCPDVEGFERPALLWVCKGDVEGVHLTQFLFKSPQNKLAYMSADILVANLPKIVVSWGEADAVDYDRRKVFCWRTIDFSENAVWAPREAQL